MKKKSKSSSKSSNTKAERKERLREETEKANHIHKVISAANAEQDLLAPLAAFCSMEVEITPSSPSVEEEAEKTEARQKHDSTRNIPSSPKTKLKVEFYTSPLPTKLRKECLGIFQQNMGSLYESSSWGLNLDEKERELKHDDARFLIVRREADNTDSQEGGASADATHSSVSKNVDIDIDDKNNIVAFCHFRFEPNDKDLPPMEQEAVLYVYEVQVSENARRGGLGRRLMSIIELIAMKRMDLKKVVLTVFKANQIAMDFYLKKMKYVIDESSPSQFVQDEGEDAVDYEILSKCIAKKS